MKYMKNMLFIYFVYLYIFVIQFLESMWIGRGWITHCVEGEERMMRLKCFCYVFKNKKQNKQKNTFTTNWYMAGHLSVKRLVRLWTRPKYKQFKTQALAESSCAGSHSYLLAVRGKLSWSHLTVCKSCQEWWSMSRKYAVKDYKSQN